jgi:hypothetical protein
MREASAALLFRSPLSQLQTPLTSPSSPDAAFMAVFGLWYF